MTPALLMMTARLTHQSTVWKGLNTGCLVDVVNLGWSAAMDALRKRGGHEFIEVAIEHGRGIGAGSAAAQVLHQLIGLQNVGPDLVPPADIGLLGIGGIDLLLLLLQLHLIETGFQHLPGG